MREQSLAGQAAFAPANTADIADAMIVSSGLRVEVDRRRGRGAGLNPTGRFEALQRETFDDGWQTWEELPPFKTEVQVEKPAQEAEHQQQVLGTGGTRLREGFGFFEPDEQIADVVADRADALPGDGLPH